MKILLLSAYNTHSHNYWCNLLIKNLPQFQWTFLQLPPRKFSWRIRGNALSWSELNSKELSETYDTILATSMVDLATIIGLNPNLGSAKKIYYFHENQFEYPLSGDKKNGNVESMMVNLYGAMAADLVLFNSNFNRDTFKKGAETLLKRINDFSPTEAVDKIVKKSKIMPVPICNKSEIKSTKIPNSIIWNHRWEYDKNPEDFYLALKELKARDIDFKLIIMGIEFKNSPEAFSKIKNEFPDNILCWGHQTSESYKSWLSKGEFIISTAIHEFQGLAVMEGVQYRAIPIVPNRLSYPQWFSKKYIYSQNHMDLADAIENRFKTKLDSPDLSSLTWDSLRSDYLEALQN